MLTALSSRQRRVDGGGGEERERISFWTRDAPRRGLDLEMFGAEEAQVWGRGGGREFEELEGFEGAKEEGG